MKKIIAVFLLLLLIGGAIGFYFFNKKVPGLEDTTPDYELTADELYNAFEENEKKAQEKYSGKVILVSGEVARVEEKKGKSTISLKAENAMIGGVNCSFPEKIATMEIGMQVKVKGRCQGYLMEVIMNNCVLVQ